jgi:transposase
MVHRNAPLSIEGRRRLIEPGRTRPIAHVAAEMGISRACASKWVNRYRQHGGLGLFDRSSTPSRQPTATSADVVAQIEDLRRRNKWSASRIAFELQEDGWTISRRTVSRHLHTLGLNHRRFLDPNGESNREPRRITACRPGRMVHIDVKKVGRIPDGGGWRAHGRGSDQAKAAERRKRKGQRAGYAYLHSAVDGYSRLACTESLSDEKASTAIAFMHRVAVSPSGGSGPILVVRLLLVTDRSQGLRDPLDFVAPLSGVGTVHPVGQQCRSVLEYTLQSEHG